MKRSLLRAFLCVVAALCVVPLIDEYFYTLPILNNVLQDFALLGILAMAECLVLVGGGMDLSVASISLFSASMAYYLVETETAVAPVALLLSVGAGALAGLANGFFITRANIQPVVVTLCTSLLMRGLSGAFTNNIALFDTCESFMFFTKTSIGGVPVPVSVLIMLVIAVFATLVFRFSTVERQVFAIGGSERSARLSGLNVNRIKMMSYCVAGLISGLAGLAVLANGPLAKRFYECMPEVEILFAALLGGVTLRARHYTFLQACIGAGFMAIINRVVYTILIYNYFRSSMIGLSALLIIAIAGGIFRRER